MNWSSLSSETEFTDRPFMHASESSSIIFLKDDQTLLNILKDHNLQDYKKILIYGAARLTNRAIISTYLNKEFSKTNREEFLINKSDKELLEEMIKLAIQEAETKFIQFLLVEHFMHFHFTSALISQIIKNEAFELLIQLIKISIHTFTPSHILDLIKHKKGIENVEVNLKTVHILELMCKSEQNFQTYHYVMFLNNLSNSDGDIEEIIEMLIKYEKNEVAHIIFKEKHYDFNFQYLSIALQANNYGFIFPYVTEIKNILHEAPKVFHLVESALDSLDKPEMHEYKFFILEQLIGQASFTQLKNYLLKISSNFLINSNKNYLFFSSNPLKMIIILLKIIGDVKRKEESLSYMCLVLREKLINLGVEIQDEVNEYEEMHNLITDKDIQGRSVLSLITELRLIEFLEHPIIHGIINDQWTSDYEMTTQFTSISTLSRIICRAKPIYIYTQDTDYTTHKSETQNFHLGMFQFWKDGAFIKYLVTLLFTTVFVILISVVGFYMQTHILEAYLVYQDQFIGQTIECYLRSMPLICPYSWEKTTQMMLYLQQEIEFVYKYCDFMLVINSIILAVFIKDLWQIIYLSYANYNLKFMISQNAVNYLRNLALCGMSIADLYLYVEIMKYTKEKEEEAGNSPHARLIGLMAGFNEMANRRLDVLMAFELSLLWLGLLILMRILPIVGPLIKIFGYMLTDIIKFMFIYFIQLMAFATISSIIFRSRIQFNTFIMSLQTLFQSSLGNFDYGWFDQSIDRSSESEFYAIIGRIYLTIFLIINMLLLINLLIALFSDTYSQVQQKSHSLFRHEFLCEFPNYSNNKKYSALVSTFMPLDSILSPFFLTLILLNSDKHKQKLNEIILRVEYVPVFLIILLAYTLVQMILLPFAYLVNLFLLLFIKREKKATFSKRLKRFIIFLLLGIFILLGLAMRDIYWFTIALHSAKKSKLSNKYKYKIRKYDPNLLNSLILYFSTLENKLVPIDKCISEYLEFKEGKEEKSISPRKLINVNELIDPERLSLISDLQNILEKGVITLEDGKEIVYISAINSILKYIVTAFKYENFQFAAESPSAIIFPQSAECIFLSLHILKLRRVEEALSKHYKTDIDSQNRIILHTLIAENKLLFKENKEISIQLHTLMEKLKEANVIS